MRTSARLTLTALAAALLLSAFVSTAPARSLSISNERIRVTWTSLEFIVIETAIRCPATLEGAFHARSVGKVLSNLIGAITRATIKQEACTNGRIAAFNGIETYHGLTPLTTLPWHLTYDSFTGTLPNISSVHLALSRFRFGITLGGTCTAEVGNGTDLLVFSAALEGGRGITGFTPVATRNIATVTRRDAGIICPNTVEVRGTGEVMVLGLTTRVTITLI